MCCISDDERHGFFIFMGYLYVKIFVLMLHFSRFLGDIADFGIVLPLTNLQSY